MDHILFNLLLIQAWSLFRALQPPQPVMDSSHGSRISTFRSGPAASPSGSHMITFMGQISAACWLISPSFSWLIFDGVQTDPERPRHRQLAMFPCKDPARLLNAGEEPRWIRSRRVTHRCGRSSWFSSEQLELGHRVCL